MAVKAKFLGREAVMRKLNKMLPDTEKELAKAQMDVAKELANRIQARAPGDGDYRQSIQADRLANRSKQELLGIRDTKDKNATGIFADFKWRWLEFGTQPRTQKTTGRFTGSGPAMPHIFPTWRAYKKTARRKLASAVNKAVRKAKS